MESSKEPSKLCEECVMEDQKLRVIYMESLLHILITKFKYYSVPTKEILGSVTCIKCDQL